MFKNAGARLMAFSKVMFVVFSVIGLLGAIGAAKAAGAFNGFLGFIVFVIVLAIGVFSAWISTIAIYAFGELCENIRAMREGMGYSEPEAEHMNFSQIGKMASDIGSSVSSAASNVGSRINSSKQQRQSRPRSQSMAASQWICPNCGKPNGPENGFCTGCGCTRN